MRVSSTRTLLPSALLVTALAGAASAQNWLDSPRLLTSGGLSPTVEQVLAVGDIDGDLDADIVGVDGSALRPLLNADGDFVESTETALGAGASLTLSRPQVGDVDGDGRGDVVLLAVSPNSIQVYRGQANGTLAAPDIVALAFAPTRFDLADFNGDGRMDIALAAGTGVGWVYFDGGAFSSTTFVDLGQNLWTISAADFDGDQLADAAVGFQFDPTVVIVPTVAGAPVAGDVFAVAGGTGDAASPWHGDLDGDGDEDLLVLSDDSFDLHFTPLLNDGAGNFAAGPGQLEPDLGEILNASEVHLGDWDGDLDVDLASQSLVGGIFQSFPIEAVLVENLGGGVFDEEVAFVLRQTGTPAGLADFDGDGHLDFCTNDSVLFGDGTFREPHAAEFNAFTRPLDWEDDGDVDLFSLNGSMRTNDGTGQFSQSLAMLPDPPAELEFWGLPVVFADLDGDGFRDFLAGRNLDNGIFEPTTFLGMHLLRDDGSLAYEDAGLAAPMGTDIAGVAGRNFATDVDMDGDVDLVLGKSTLSIEQEAWLNDGTGFFPAAPVTLFSGFAIGMGDVDADGDMDFLQMDTSVAPRPLSVAVNVGGLVFQSSDIMTSADTIESTARFADLDEDGDLDVVVSVRRNLFLFPHEVWVIENTGPATFGSPALVGSTPEDISIVGAGDVDGDGLADVLAGTTTASTQAEKLLVLRREGPGLTYEPARAWYQRPVSAFVDVDSDGDVDAVGSSLVSSRAFAGPDSGFARQYGTGVAGTGEAVPLLGAHGPFDAGSTTLEIRLRRAVGGTGAFLLFGTLEASIPDFGLPGFTGYVLGFFGPFFLATDGSPGTAGTGTWTLPVSPGPALIGSSFFHQVFLADANGPFGFTASNGLEIHYGL